ncbi:ABC transporter ATP-binding protein [Kosmotoga pacifica]|uniref:Heme ABC transporter ATP-binding protein n=1 Tax=Kosmotoga pacifica TaxID=1330330 RepID=A0A0G2Z9E1_9BACT|nr:heme ABC transporter ATP-binding protein [Kosmotoga pacifica]
MKGIVKRFPSVVANDHVDFFVKKGEIHALVGENGAGKSTLMKQLYGLYTPDEGEIYINGKRVHFKGPKDAIVNGIGMVHQHFMLVDNQTVAENVILGSEPRRGVFLDINKARKEVKELSEKFGLAVDVDAKIEDIPVGMQQRVEILKILYRGANILIFDEPTAVLTPQETEELFNIMRLLKNSGKTIIFITHKLNEVMAITERVTVMRLGKVTGNVLTKDTNPREIATMMVGREVLLRVEKEKAQPSDIVLKVEDLWVKDNRGLDAVRGVSLEVRAGEIVGIAGVAGNGQTELVEAITGLRKVEKGHIFLLGKDMTNASPLEFRESGLTHIPEDRIKRGMISQYPVYYNIILGKHGEEPFAKNGILNLKAIKGYATELIERFDVRPRDMDILAGNLSGGNQQKMVVARELDKTPVQPKVVVVAQPTRGLDIGAIEFIHKTIISMRDRGIGILLISMELDEIFSLSDRILVFYEGEIMGEVTPDEVTREEIGLMMAGHKKAEVLGERGDVK